MAVNFLLKRSNTASKRPTAAQLDIGELSLNYDANTAGVFFEDSAGNVRKVGPAEVSATAPNATPAGSSGNSLGELWFDTSVNNLKVWTGAAFANAMAAAAAGGSNTQVQYNSSGTLAGSANLTFNGTTLSTNLLSVTQSSGDEGGQIDLAKAVTNTTLTTGISIDVFRNLLRIFETGGTNRGASMDLTAQAASVGSTIATSANKLSLFSATTSAELAGVISDETGSGALVFANSPTLVTPVLGVATGTSFNSITGLSSTNPAALGTVAVGTATTTARADHVHPTTGLGLTSGTLAQFAATTSAQLAGVISDETGSGALVFGTSPSLTTPALSGETFSTSAAVTAGTNAQGQGALTSDYSVITTATANPSGVTLPTATTGRRVIVVNKGANPINIYPATGASIDALAANASLQLGVDAVAVFNAASATLWYSSVNTQINAAELTGTVPSGVLGNSSLFIGTTSIALNRASASQALTGITSIDGSAATLTTARTLTIGATGKTFNGSANVSWSLAEIGAQAALGFTPVQQGGGTSQTANKLYIGWSTGNQLRLQVDVTDFGASWPINVTGSAATLTTTRTLWGQNFNGAANVTGSLTSVGDITGSGAVTLSSAAASALNLNSGTTGAVTLDSGTTGAVNIGNNANAKTITIGNATGATSIVLNCGTGALDVGANAIARTVTVGNTTGASTLNLRGGTGGVAISTGTTGIVSIDSGTTGAINIGTGANAKTITVGNATGATSVVVDCGTGALNLGSNAVARTITLGNTTGASTLNINSGTGGILVTSPHLTMANQGEIRFREASGGGTNYIGLEAPAAVAADLTFLLPGADGTTTSGYTLKSNGSAALSFGTANIVTADTAPSSPLDGDLWYNSDSGRLFVYYSDANTNQWVDASPDSSGVSNIRILDSIASSFNGTTATFNLRVSSVAVTPVSAQQLLIVVGGIVQIAGTHYTVSGSTITFTAGNIPTSGLTFYGVIYGDAATLNTVADGAITTAKIQNSSVTAAKLSIDGNVLPTVDNSFNLGSASFRFANIFTGDLHLKNDRGDWTIIEEEDCLTMRNNKTGKVYNIMMTERTA